MSFGLKSAPRTFQRLMNGVLIELIGTRCFVYLDIIILVETLQEHHTRLRELLEKLRQYNLKIDLHKCDFPKTELNCLGHVLTNKGVKPDPQKIEAVNEFPNSKNKNRYKVICMTDMLLS